MRVFILRERPRLWSARTNKVLSYRRITYSYSRNNPTHSPSSHGQQAAPHARDNGANARAVAGFTPAGHGMVDACMDRRDGPAVCQSELS